MNGGTVAELSSSVKADGVLNHIAPNVFRVDVNLTRRKTVEGAIDQLIALLDAMDPDADLELAGDELHCSWSQEWGPQAGGLRDEDAEPDHDDEDGGDAEPTFGSTGSSSPITSQVFWSHGDAASDEYEEENEHGGDVVDEPHDRDWTGHPRCPPWSKNAFADDRSIIEPGDVPLLSPRSLPLISDLACTAPARVAVDILEPAGHGG